MSTTPPILFGAALAQGAGENEVWLDIPSQPLAAALRDYGKATGVEVFYDGALAAGHRSMAGESHMA